MLKLISKKNPAETHWFLVGKKYTVGRRAGDLAFPEDQSISRNHAEIEVDFPRANVEDPSLLPTLNVMDIGSKFGSFFNIEGQDSAELVEMNMREPVSLVHGNTVRFGRQWNEFRVEYTPLVAVASSLSNEDKKEVKEIVWKLGGHFESNWSTKANFVVMSEVTLTIKAVCGLLAGNYIVTPQYFKDLLRSIESNQPAPEPREYEPRFVESIPETGVNLQLNPARKKLFAGKTFVFSTSQQAKRLSVAVTAGGGTFKVIKDCTEVFVESPECLVFECPKNGFLDSHVKRCIDAYKNSGKRLISESDLSLAALYSSVAKYCNPYTKPPQLFAPMTSQTQRSQARPATVLVPETQPDDKPPLNDNTRMVVDESLNISAGSDRSSSSSRNVGVSELGKEDTKKRGKHLNIGEADNIPSAKRRLESLQPACTFNEPSPKRRKAALESISTQSTNTRNTRSKVKAKSLSQIFGMSDSDDDDNNGLNALPSTHEDSQSQSQLRPGNVSAVPATDFDFVGIQGKHLKSPNKPSQGQCSKTDNAAASTSGKPYVDFVPGTPDASDEEDAIFAGLFDPSKITDEVKSYSSTISKNKVLDVIELDGDDRIDISAMPTVKLSTIPTDQLPTLAIQEKFSEKKRKKAVENKCQIKIEQEDNSLEIPKGMKKMGNLSSWVISSKRKNSGTVESTISGESSKKRRVTMGEEETDIKPQVKMEADEQSEVSLMITPAPFEVISIMKSLPDICELKPKIGPGSIVPNFKTFRKVLPLSAVNSTMGKRTAKSVKLPYSVNMFVADVDYIDDAVTALDQQENSQLVKPVTINTIESTAEIASTSNSTRAKQKERKTPIPVVVAVDPDDIGSEGYNFEDKNAEYDPSDGMFDF